MESLVRQHAPPLMVPTILNTSYSTSGTKLTAKQSRTPVLAKYGGNRSGIGRVKYLVFKDMMQLLIRGIPVLTMARQLEGHGSALTNPRKDWGGGILRDGQGNLVYAYAIPLGFGTMNKRV
ncbi:hypothetical protein H5410_013513 [Solanum commersonii]|uniref:Uncharacterized protein n=1 Tax=Solanum commersonii TaxID=4109 RepID=A0A9J5ZNF3_SOLCO|nr:hypothetical protein H5410_013513 [Solanum commersonii]